MARRTPSIRSLLETSPVVPVLMIDRVEHAVPLARALAAGDVRVLEITLRTAAALDAARAIARDVPEVTVGLGTITRPEDLAAAAKVGARFAVSPGFTPELLAAADDAKLPFMPGVVTASEIMTARAAGYTTLKFFPAEIAGGVRTLNAMAPLFPDVAFCPTGGVDESNAGEYLALGNVVAVGGSWLAPPDRVAAGDWPAITRIAEAATRTAARALGRR